MEPLLMTRNWVPSSNSKATNETTSQDSLSITALKKISSKFTASRANFRPAMKKAIFLFISLYHHYCLCELFSTFDTMFFSVQLLSFSHVCVPLQSLLDCLSSLDDDEEHILSTHFSSIIFTPSHSFRLRCSYFLAATKR